MSQVKTDKSKNQLKQPNMKAYSRFFPENFNAACAAKQMTPPLLQVAEGAGYARELCGYFLRIYFRKEMFDV
ncbi:MAG: hypothetical protein PHZ11_09745 [Desulfitobacteriaceae bacterium]|nr:hypothetical protein [Desulfitobacteriaceae bacterium]MDD4347139.1 hypothetical protein [Desulfitobacteriaceae bacterium]MDD4401522.1 hypothetical protein [Desulfitobacteriaceae bacterium]